MSPVFVTPLVVVAPVTPKAPPTLAALEVFKVVVAMSPVFVTPFVVVAPATVRLFVWVPVEVIDVCVCPEESATVTPFAVIDTCAFGEVTKLVVTLPLLSVAAVPVMPKMVTPLESTLTLCPLSVPLPALSVGVTL